MANIIRHQPSREEMAYPGGGRFDPWRVFRDLMRWDPFRELERVGAPEWAGFSPDIEVKETADSYVFKADLPGVKEEDVDVTVAGNRLTISGRREEEKREENENYYVNERTYGGFTRSFTLPDGADADGASADLRDGVLTLRVPKKTGAQAKKIPLGAAKGKPAKA